MSAAEPMAYVARMACGHIVAAQVDDATHPAARADLGGELKRWIKAGYTVERVTCERVRTAETLHGPGRCPATPRPTQPDLIAPTRGRP